MCASRGARFGSSVRERTQNDATQVDSSPLQRIANVQTVPVLSDDLTAQLAGALVV
jgi:hypothetical protein